MARMSILFKVSPRSLPALARVLLAAATLAIVPLAAARAAALKAAVFPFELLDTSLNGEHGGSRARLKLIDGELRDLLAKSGRYEPVPLGDAVVKAAAGEDLRTCDGCEVPLAREAGADVSVVGWVQKVSELILNINLVIRDVKTGQVLEGGSVDIRGDTDESWSRGVRYLVHERLKIGAGGGSGQAGGSGR
jgi:Protein of unknown function (DUF2380)